jgi:hypothetical protein
MQQEFQAWVKSGWFDVKEDIQEFMESDVLTLLFHEFWVDAT